MTVATAQPTWSKRHALGVLLNKHMDHNCTLQELANELGTTKQMAYHESVVALGAFGLKLCERMGIPASQAMRALQCA